jgi:single-strand DNA-binding protein
MSGETFVTVIGTLSKDPELKFQPSGGAVTRITVVSNARKFNKQTNEWEKRPGKFWDAQAWNSGKALLAENIANTLKKGDTVILYGELETREWQAEDGTKRRADQIRIEAIGKDLRWHQAYANEVPAANNTPAEWGTAPQGNGPGGHQPAAQSDPWATPPQGAGNGGGWGNGPESEPPF